MILASGFWEKDITWKIVLTDVAPPIGLCTAVACVAIADISSEQIVLIKNQRGWEIIAGHIEPGETPEQTLAREALEESGFTVSNYKLFGYREITASRRPSWDNNVTNYPFPTSYIPYYFAVTKSAITLPTGKEILESKTCTSSEIEALVLAEQLHSDEQLIIKHGIKAAHVYLKL